MSISRATRSLGLAACGLVLAAVFAASPACIPTDPCLRNSDCSHGERCIEGACALPPVEAPSGDATADGDAGAEADVAEVEVEAGADAAETGDDGGTD